MIFSVGRALSVCDRTPYEHGVTGGMSAMLGEIERLACEGEPEETGGLRAGWHGKAVAQEDWLDIFFRYSFSVNRISKSVLPWISEGDGQVL